MITPGLPDIRQITLAEVAAFHATLDAVARERRYLAMLEGPRLERVREFVAKNIEHDYVHLVAMDGPTAAGWCDITPGAHGEAHVGKLGMGVLKDYRSRGIGRRLLEAAIAKARTKEFEKIELRVYASNLPACRLYQKNGFTVEGVRKRARLVDGIHDDIVLMALFLN
ncbi:MAG TPA: GNAT family N-acetyltransferase [Opitutales bacterium]|nr:GNAT family N-acetyltransferase [Opitutales bacterium]